MTTTESPSLPPLWTPRPESVAAALGAGFWMLFILRGDLLNPAAEGFPLTYRIHTDWPNYGLDDRFYIGAFLIDLSLAVAMMACAYATAQVLSERFCGHWTLTTRSACGMIAGFAIAIGCICLSTMAAGVFLIASGLFTLVSPFLLLIVVPLELDRRERWRRACRAAVTPPESDSS